MRLYKCCASLGVMTVRSDWPLTTFFGIFKHQLGFIEAAVARPSHITEQVGFVGGAVHTVNRQRLRRDDFYAGFFVRHITACSHCTQIPSTFCICAVRFPIGSAFQRMRYFGTIVHTHACAVVDVPHSTPVGSRSPNRGLLHRHDRQLCRSHRQRRDGLLDGKPSRWPIG